MAYYPSSYGTVDPTGTASSRAAIQGAIDAAAAAGGGTVILPSGTLKLDNTLQITSDGVALVGQGYSSLLTVSSAPANNHVLWVHGTSGTPIKGVQLAGFRVQGYGDNAGVTASRHGIFCQWSDWMKISDIYAHDCTFAALKMDDCEHNVVSDISVLPGTRGTTGGWYGIEMTCFNKGAGARGYSGYHTLTNITTHTPEHSVAVYLCDDVTITNLTATGGQDDYCINWTGAQRVSLTNFTMVTNGGGYIYTEYDQTLGTSRACADLKFSNGFCKGLVTAPSGGAQPRDLAGIFGTYSPDTSLHDIYLDCSAQTGAQSSNGVDGISFDSNSPRLRVVQCTINNPIRDGIRINADGAFLMRNRIISPRGSASNSGGINLTTGSQHIVQNNRIEGGAANGIYANSINTQISDNIVTSVTADGIVTNAADCIIRNNYSTNQTGFGITIKATAVRTKMENNFCQTNTGGNYSISSSATASVIGRNNKGLTNDSQARSSSFTLNQADLVNVVDANAAARTVTLPAATGVNNGKMYYIKNKVGSANDVTVARAGSDTIDGATSLTLTAGQSALLVCDGASLWNVI